MKAAMERLSGFSVMSEEQTNDQSIMCGYWTFGLVESSRVPLQRSRSDSSRNLAIRSRVPAVPTVGLTAGAATAGAASPYG